MAEGPRSRPEGNVHRSWKNFDYEVRHELHLKGQYRTET